MFFKKMSSSQCATLLHCAQFGNVEEITAMEFEAEVREAKCVTCMLIYLKE